MTVKPSGKILKTKKEIMSFLDIKGDDAFTSYVEIGMPARVINGRWHAFTENLEQWFQVVTRRGDGKIPANAE